MESADKRIRQIAVGGPGETVPGESTSRGQRERRFSLHFAERRLLLVIVDLLVANAALYATLRLRPDIDLATTSLSRSLLWAIVWSATWLSAGMLLEIYELSNAARRYYSSWLAGGTALLASAAYTLMPWIAPGIPDRRLFLILLPLLVAPVAMLWRHVYASIFAGPAFQERVLVVGAGWAGRTFAEAVAARTMAANKRPTHGAGYTILGFIDDDPAKQQKKIGGVPVLGTRADLVAHASALAPDKIVLAITHSQSIHGELFQALLDCQEMGIPLSTMAHLYERLTGRIPVQHAGRDLQVVLPTGRPATHRLYLALRRLVDIWAGFLGCLVVALLFPVIWVANRLTSPGSTFYRQERIGRGGHSFQVIKFRSMIEGAERDTGAVWASENDSRATLVGAFLRRTRLDELPQCWNILKGEMSLIGPRPERPPFVDKLDGEIPFYRLRHSMKPGLTGWAQVNYGYGASAEDAHVKLQYDLYYIKHQSLYLDLQIVLRTVLVILGLKGR